MWQIYAQTAFELVEQRRREALAHRIRRLDDDEVRRGDPLRLRRLMIGALSAFSRGAGVISDASCALASRLESGRGSA